LGVGFGVWGLGFGGCAPNPQPPIPNPQITRVNLESINNYN